ncbi:single-stranded DNA-binding protein [Kitasatospora sp. NPDC092039]|uniref:single-stranded DNA-binding protein n=1 Tax=Kitasatospora sp. NPDC092039 TaxID=3364086 RepID=UPI003800EE61
MTERRKSFDQEAVAKALGAKPQEVVDPAFGEGQHFQVQTDQAFLSLDTFPESGVSRITTKGARIELYGGALPQVEEEGIVFLQKDSDHEHSTVALHPDGGLTLGYQVDAGPAKVDGLPDDLEDTEQIITREEAVKVPAEAEQPGHPAREVVNSVKNKFPTRAPGAYPDERPAVQPVEAGGTEEDPLAQARQIRGGDQAPSQAAEDQPAKESGPPRVQVVGRLGRNPTVRETAGGKLVGKFPLAIHLENGETQWQDVLAFGERARALKKRMEEGELVKGREVEVVGYEHEREYKGRDGTTKTAREIYSVAIKKR